MEVPEADLSLKPDVSASKLSLIDCVVACSPTAGSRACRAHAPSRSEKDSCRGSAPPCDDRGMESPGFPCLHVSLGNARNGQHETDLPHLLRRVADMIEEDGIKPTEILDLTVESEITENGPWWSATVYWSPDGDEPSE